MMVRTRATSTVKGPVGSQHGAAAPWGVSLAAHTLEAQLEGLDVDRHGEGVLGARGSGGKLFGDVETVQRWETREAGDQRIRGAARLQRRRQRRHAAEETAGDVLGDVAGARGWCCGDVGAAMRRGGVDRIQDGRASDTVDVIAAAAARARAPQLQCLVACCLQRCRRVIG